jgi:cobalamin biosynthesis protein CobT
MKPKLGKPKEGAFNFKIPKSAGAGTRIEAGKYPGKCVGVVYGRAKSSGNPMYTWAFVITKGEYAGKDFPLYTADTEDAAWKILETLQGLGFEVEAGDSLKITRKDVMGRRCILNVVDDEYQGRPQSKLQGIEPDPKGGFAKTKGNPLVDEEDEEDEEESKDESDEDESEDEDEEDEDEDEEDDEDEDDEDDDDEDEDENEDPFEDEPKKPSKKVKSKPVKKPARRARR